MMDIVIVDHHSKSVLTTINFRRSYFSRSRRLARLKLERILAIHNFGGIGYPYVPLSRANYTVLIPQTTSLVTRVHDYVLIETVGDFI